MKTTTKYIAIRETAGMNARTYRRYKEYESEGLAIAWFAGSDLGTSRTVSIYAVEFEDGEDLSTMQPCAKKNIPNVGTLVYKKRHDKVIYDRREEEAEESAVAEEAPAEPTEVAEPIKAGEPVRYYVVLKIAENRKQTCFHFKRRVFYDDQKAIDFARSRLRGGCRAAWVYMYDPVTVKVPPELFESDNPKRDTDNIGKFLGRLEIFRIDSHSWSDMRDRVYAEIREADKVQATA